VDADAADATLGPRTGAASPRRRIARNSRVHDTRIRVRNFEALDRTPVVDLKPWLGSVGER